MNNNLTAGDFLHNAAIIKQENPNKNNIECGILLFERLHNVNLIHDNELKTYFKEKLKSYIFPCVFETKMQKKYGLRERLILDEYLQLYNKDSSINFDEFIKKENIVVTNDFIKLCTSLQNYLRTYFEI